MKKLLSVLCLLPALAACSTSEPPPAPAPTATPSVSSTYLMDNRGDVKLTGALPAGWKVTAQGGDKLKSQATTTAVKGRQTMTLTLRRVELGGAYTPPPAKSRCQEEAQAAQAAGGSNFKFSIRDTGEAWMDGCSLTATSSSHAVAFGNRAYEAFMAEVKVVGVGASATEEEEVMDLLCQAALDKLP